MPISVSMASLHERPGQEIAASEWMVVTQSQIDRFAEATGDDQWIHTNPQRAAASPFGGTIAHGFLTLSMLSVLLRQAITVEQAAVTINYGVNRVRFVTPVRAGARIRARFAPATAEELPEGIQVTWTVIVDLEGSARPACVAEWIIRYLR